MSFNLYWRPRPKRVPEPKSGYALKWAIAKRYGSWGGSCREGPWEFGVDDILWLERVRDRSNKETAQEADELIKCIRANPQGVMVWIGDSDDA